MGMRFKLLIIILFVSTGCFSQPLKLLLQKKAVASGGVKTAKINFSSTSLPATTWNNLIGNPNTGIRSIANLVDTTGANTGWTVTTIGTETQRWGNFSGVTSTDNLAAALTGMDAIPGATSNVWASFYFNYCGGTSNYNASFPQLRLGGLNTSKTYEITFVCADGNNSFGSNPTRVRIVGATSPAFADLNGNSGAINVTNGSTSMTIISVVPNGSSQIDIWFNGTGGSSEYAILNALRIREL